MATVVVTSDGREQAAISDGARRVRLDLAHGTLLQGPVDLRYLLHGFADLDVKLLTLRRLSALRRLGRFARRLHPRERQAARWIAALRVHDAICTDASQPEIARLLFGGTTGGLGEHDRSHSLRLRIQRLARIGRHMTSDGYRGLLR